MYSFLLLALPCLLVYFLNSKLAKGSYWLAFCLGFFPALIYCIIDEFFIFTSYHFSDSAGSNYIYLLLKDILIPSIILCGFYILFSRRELKDRATAMIPLLAAFYMAYIPYGVITGKEKYCFFLSFIKPLLFCSYIILLPLCCRGLITSIKEKKKPLIPAFALGILISPTLSPLAEVLWYMNYPSASWIGITVFMIAASVILFLFMSKTDSNTLDKSI